MVSVVRFLWFMLMCVLAHMDYYCFSKKGKTRESTSHLIACNPRPGCKSTRTLTWHKCLWMVGNHTPKVSATPTVENPGDLHPQRAGLCLVKPRVVWHRQLVRSLPSPETWEWGRPKTGSSQDWINPGWATKGVPRNWHNSLVIACRPKWWGPA